MNMKLLEKYENKVKVSINGIIQWITVEEYENTIKQYNEYILKAKKWGEQQSKLDALKIKHEIDILKQRKLWEKIMKEWNK